MDLFLGTFLRLRVSLWLFSLKKKQEILPKEYDFYIDLSYIDLRVELAVPFCRLVLIFPTEAEMNAYLDSSMRISFSNYVTEKLREMGIARIYIEFASEEDIKRSGAPSRWHYFK
ncbi:MAG: hypothetical protein KA116_10980 [Proteobacteria bacterium]|nr:hypothetical protein [Pseudomonadota bacterium]